MFNIWFYWLWHIACVNKTCISIFTNTRNIIIQLIIGIVNPKSILNEENKWSKNKSLIVVTLPRGKSHIINRNESVA